MRAEISIEKQGDQLQIGPEISIEKQGDQLQIGLNFFPWNT